MARERILTREAMMEKTGEVLLEFGYEKFSFSLLAERLNVTRTAVYKYYANSDALLMDYMLYQMERFTDELNGMDNEPDFLSQFNFLIRLLYKHSAMHQILRAADQIPFNSRAKTEEGMKHFQQMYREMYKKLQTFISLGKKEKHLRPDIPDEIIIVLLYQLVEIPATEGIDREEWMKQVIGILKRGMFASS